ncbi:DsbA family protein [Anaplasma bovis]|uniref:DsbA family protein n=1 Tax=Anaplasma bovis TaxID=186733 RepID=UPI002FF3D5F3
MARIFCLLGLIVLVASFPLMGMWVSAVKGRDRSEIEAIIEEYIYKNPDKVVNAISRGQVAINKRKTRTKILESKLDLEDNSYPSFGAGEDGILLVEFFDYSCGYCKAVLPQIKQLLADEKARISFRDLPTLGESSTLAARAALAVYLINSDKYIDFYYAALNHSGRFTEAAIIDIVESIGISKESFTRSLEENSGKIEDMLSATRSLASRLNITGTPSVVVGDTVFVGSSDLQTLRDIIQGEIDEKKR